MRHSLCHHQDDSANYVNKLFRKFIRTSEHIKYVDYIVECSLQVLCKCFANAILWVLLFANAAIRSGGRSERDGRPIVEHLVAVSRRLSG